MKLLGGSITERPNATIKTVRSERLQIKMPNNSEINHPDLAIISNNKIIGFNVPVYNFGCFEIAARIKQSLDQNNNVADILYGQRSQLFPVGMTLNKSFQDKNLVVVGDLPQAGRDNLRNIG